jgi:ribosomal protein L11 methyltransferase
MMCGRIKQPPDTQLDHGVGWIEVILHVEGEEIVEGVGNFILEEGSGGIVIEEGHFPFRSVLKAFFLDDTTAKGKIGRLMTYIDSLKALFPGRPIAHLSFQPIDDRDWLQAYRESYKGTRVTDRIDIKPSWDGERKRKRKRKREEEILIEIDPGMAFGTGLHPSTRLCLQALEERLNDLPTGEVMRVLDVGTGSGILAIAAAKMGARDVLAIDVDPTAAMVAMENIARNGCQDRVKVVAGAIRGIKGRFELIVANITEGVHEENTNFYWSGLENRGFLILSGILREGEGKLCETYTRKGFSLIEKKEMEGWSSLIFKKEGIAQG